MKPRPVAAAIAISVGIIILLGYFLPIPLLVPVRIELLHWAVILAGVAVLVGVGNLFSVHFQKLRRREKGSVYSLTLLVAMLATLLVGVLTGPDHPWMQAVVTAIIIPAEASLMALLAVTLLYASIRLLRRRADTMTIVFLGSAILMLAASISLPLLGEIPILGDWVRPWLIYTPVAGGARGLLLGVALGALVTGLRALFALDRPYGGK
ncbi:MAG: hypothetical protein JETCAE02_23700 [Anaerolineaceae bacterium]|jgi:hypothetical protein|nr:hypothetical protein [Anaerolineae bacterium]MBV6466821.1 hypothetical protein [Anaerolineales bacterium]MDL1925403.1 hypothetical protein [Anaerolineae bacterium AMX1]GER78484.1 conserved hypothetical protein [Candidatus Denitrolinea symbiosum]GIK08059.1 MAG: hypothetical protein BroJett001_01250 [Chloroflexota bacterium]GJQ39958.1 MAG: hypothetical protein JETCAE02_23700 [Anaerolineaceae bacterium]